MDMRRKPEPNTPQEGGHYPGGFFPSPQELDAIRTFPRVYEKQLQDVYYRERTSRKPCTKRVAASVLDHPETAPGKKPRGAASISKVLSEHVKPGSKIASDGWISTTKAAKDNGLKMLGTCDHGTNFRNPRTGVHSNDAESEVARYKKWHRSKWTSVRTLHTKDQSKKQKHMEGKISEYVLQTNIGDAMQVDMATIMQALSKLAREQTWSAASFTHVTWGPTCAKVVSVLQKLLHIETLKDILHICIYICDC